MKMSTDRWPAKSQLTIVHGIFQFSSQVPNKKLYINHDSLNIRPFTKHITEPNRHTQVNSSCAAIFLDVKKANCMFQHSKTSVSKVSKGSTYATEVIINDNWNFENLPTSHMIIVMRWTLNFNRDLNQVCI